MNAPFLPSNVVNIQAGDCCQLLKDIEPESAALAFCDPPFNVGYEYDVYNDKREYDEYMNWCADWGTLVRGILKPGGSFWLHIGDEFVADLKVFFCRKLHFKLRSWIVWYYTFGVNCTRKFTRSHAHFLHFTISDDFAFYPDDIKVPSARQLVYNDKRASSGGRLPDDTWILRPQWAGGEIHDGSMDTWYVPRVCGTFKERIDGAPNQLPEEILRRIILCSTRPGDLIVDPMIGSGTSIAVAKKLGRYSIGYELSPAMVAKATSRVNACKWGEWLPAEGPPQPNAKIADSA